MKIKEDEERLKALLTDTITMLCKNSIIYKQEFCVEALIGITLDKEDVLLVNIKEIVGAASELAKDDRTNKTIVHREQEMSLKRKKHRNRRKKRTKSNLTDGADSISQSTDEVQSDAEELSNKKRKVEIGCETDQNIPVTTKQEESDDSYDVMYVKSEPKSSPDGVQEPANNFVFTGESSMSSSLVDTSVHLNLNDVFQQHQQSQLTQQQTSQLSPSQQLKSEEISEQPLSQVNNVSIYLKPERHSQGLTRFNSVSLSRLIVSQKKERKKNFFFDTS